jgi:hypothetical protein
MPIQAIEGVFSSYQEGRPAILATGRSLYDLGVDPGDGKIRPLLEILRREARKRFGMLLVTYSMAAGFDWDGIRIEDQRDRHTIETALRAHGLMDIPQDHNEVIRVIRGIASLSRTPTEGLVWASHEPLRFLFLIEFGEHLAPGNLTNGTQTEPQLIAIEWAHLTAQSLALRNSGNLIVFTAREGMVDDLVIRSLHQLRMHQPSPEEKAEFVAAGLKIYTNARFEESLTDESVVHLSTNTPNRCVESLIRASHRTGSFVTASDLTEEKRRAITDLSEGTLTFLDTTRVKDLDLQGRNIGVPKRLLKLYSKGLATGDSNIPRSVAIVGPPGTGKTDMALETAREAGVAALQLNSPKDPLVGGTERKARLQQELLREWIPNLAFIDEITEALPLERNEFDGDSGASRAVNATLLNVLSDESLRGKSQIMGTTNCPWRMGAAMRSRFRFIPVLHPLREDFPAIIISTAKRVDGNIVAETQDSRIREAADIFFFKGANPRHIRGALSHIRLICGKIGPGEVLLAAQDFAATTDLNSMIYADLWAIAVASFQSDLPWAEDPAGYPLPPHLQGIVDPKTGKVDEKKLWERISELQPKANV